MSTRSLVLVCNSHLDPVWLWEWEEGLAEALATFRTAARFCREDEHFVFCHNEALLYEWVEEHEPPLFEEIRHLVRAGRWHIMGGWYLQPDVNLPSGESLVRQILVGRRYLQEKLGAAPRVAANLDAFGHPRGLVQILRKSGYIGYLFCRPDAQALTLPDQDFLWVGYDGSTVVGHRAPDHYNSRCGQAGQKVRKWLAANASRQDGLLLWGIGDHGGGPSREDLRQIAQIQEETTDREVVHGRPEDYFDRLHARREDLPRHEGDLRPWGVGCYTSMSIVKRGHRRLEGLYSSVERLAAHAAIRGLIAYPRDRLGEALKDLLFCEFHDILSGTSIADAEAGALRRLAHGDEILRRLRMRIFTALVAAEPPAVGEEFPIHVLQTHPYDDEMEVVAEFQPLEPSLDRTIWMRPILTDADGQPVPCQVEKERSNILDDQRRRIAFRARLKATSLHRFSCRLAPAPATERPALPPPPRDPIVHRSGRCEVVINHRTGCLDRYRVDGVDYLEPGAGRPLLMHDDADPWGMRVRAFGRLDTAFRLADPQEAARLCGLDVPELSPVRIIEDGPVHTTVEVVLVAGSSAVVLRYRLSRASEELGVECRVLWRERDRMLKLAFPSAFPSPACYGQVPYGTERFERPGEEWAAQQWIALVSPDERHALTIINDGTYGFDLHEGAVRLSLLRAAAYAAHPVVGQPHVLRQDRYEPRLDQGEHIFRFWIRGGERSERLARVTREAQQRNDPPFVLCYSPPGQPRADQLGAAGASGLRLGDGVVQVTAIKLAEDGDRLIVRLFEPAGVARETTVEIPARGIRVPVALTPFEVKTLSIDVENGEAVEVDLLERRT